MTQHIEPAAWMWTDSTGCVHMAGDRPDIYTAAATVAQLPEPLYDAAALAAAEERGRIEERERLVKIVKRRMAVYQTKESASDCFQEPSNSNWDMYRYTRESHEWLLDAITKEPIP